VKGSQELFQATKCGGGAAGDSATQVASFLADIQTTLFTSAHRQATCTTPIGRGVSVIYDLSHPGFVNS